MRSADPAGWRPCQPQPRSAGRGAARHPRGRGAAAAPRASARRSSSPSCSRAWRRCSASSSTPDGGLLPANGGGDCVSAASRGRRCVRMAGSIRNSPSRACRPTSASRPKELTVYIDAGPGPDRPHGGHAHAGALALTVDDGPERIITSCGANPELDPALRDAARRTAAHSVLSLNGEDSAVFTVDPATGMRAPEGPAQLAVRRMEEGDQYLLEGQHARLARPARPDLSPEALRGDERRADYGRGQPLASDVGSCRQPSRAGSFRSRSDSTCIPDVQVADGPDDRTVFLGLPQRQRVWRFRSETLLSVENSRYWGGEAAQKIAAARDSGSS